MKVFVKTEKEVFIRESDSAQLLLRSISGGYILLPASKSITKYNGLYQPIKNDSGWDLFKTVEDIDAGKEVMSVVKGKGSFERIYTDGKDTFRLEGEALIYEALGRIDKVNLTLDMRYIHDYSVDGRIYNIYVRDGIIIIRYRKFYDGSFSDIDYEHYLGIKGAEDFLESGRWVEKDYPYDTRRGSGPHRFFVYDTTKIKLGESKKLIIMSAESEDKLLEKLDKKVALNISSVAIKRTDDPSIELAKEAIAGSYVEIGEHKGIYAGLPWFYQFWTRDEAISLEGLIRSGKEKEAKGIILRQIRDMYPDGRLGNRFPHSELGSADGTGWVFKRAIDNISYFSEDERKEIIVMMKRSVEETEAEYMVDGFIVNRPKETWMDTAWGGDIRDGVRIEVQALMLFMYKHLHKLSGGGYFKKREETLRQKIRERMFDGKKLYDGLEDAKIRPNIFLAYYIYPEMLEKEDWIKAFDSALEGLWLDWGGIASIDKDDPLFAPEYSGQDNRSYHRGDSWFFLNHIAAITMLRLDKERYSEQIDRIVQASKEDMLSDGIIGEISEVSSADRREPCGCLAQAWSAATYVEMTEEILERRGAG